MIIEVVIAPDGSVTTKVQGGCGKSCADATRPIREALGETVSDVKLPEYAANPKQAVKVGGK